MPDKARSTSDRIGRSPHKATVRPRSPEGLLSKRGINAARRCGALETALELTQATGRLAPSQDHRSRTINEKTRPANGPGWLTKFNASRQSYFRRRRDRVTRPLSPSKAMTDGPGILKPETVTAMLPNGSPPKGRLTM